MGHHLSPDSKVLAWRDLGPVLTAHASLSAVEPGSGQSTNGSALAHAARLWTLTEQEAVHELRKLGVDYIAVKFGGAIGLTADDIGQLTTMARLAAHVDDSISVGDFLTKA